MNEGRILYIDQFREFVKNNKLECKIGQSEVKFKVDNSRFFGSLYCIDFAKNDGQLEAIEFTPTKKIVFEPFEFVMDEKLNVTFQSFAWHDTRILFSTNMLPEKELKRWFSFWFDFDDRRNDLENKEFCEIIHFLAIEPNFIDIDFGTAPVDALLSMLNILAQHGVKEVTLTTSLSA